MSTSLPFIWGAVAFISMVTLEDFTHRHKGVSSKDNCSGTSPLGHPFFRGVKNRKNCNNLAIL